MQDRPAQAARNRIFVSDETVKFLCDSTAAGNGFARATLKGACPTCGEHALKATVRFREAEMKGAARLRHYHVVASCSRTPCAFTGETGGRFTLR